MKNKTQSGFSLIELLLVLVIIGVLSTIAIPSLIKARSAAENSSAFAIMRTMATLQVSFFQQHNRFGRLDELNNTQNGVLGTFSGNTLTRGRFTYELVPDPSPTDAQLRDGYKIKATRIIGPGDSAYELTVDQSGIIDQL